MSELRAQAEERLGAALQRVQDAMKRTTILRHDYQTFPNALAKSELYRAESELAAAEAVVAELTALLEEAA